jgi:hypothetical protein
MNKLFKVLSLVLVLSVNGAFASIDIAIGMNRFDLEVEGVDTDPGFGFHFGAFYLKKLGENTSLKTGVLYVQRHYELNSDGVEYAYIDIPAQLEFSISRDFSIFAGPKLSLNYEDDDGSAVENTVFFFDVGFTMPLNKALSLDVYYETSLTPIAEVGSTEYDSTSLGGTVRYRF